MRACVTAKLSGSRPPLAGTPAGWEGGWASSRRCCRPPSPPPPRSRASFWLSRRVGEKSQPRRSLGRGRFHMRTLSLRSTFMGSLETYRFSRGKCLFLLAAYNPSVSASYTPAASFCWDPLTPKWKPSSARSFSRRPTFSFRRGLHVLHRKQPLARSPSICQLAPDSRPQNLPFQNSQNSSLEASLSWFEGRGGQLLPVPSEEWVGGQTE